MATLALPAGRIGIQQLPQIGRGRPEEVVMIHGLGANMGFWYASAVQWFRRFGRVTLFDLPGHGESDMPERGYTPAQLADRLCEVMDQLGVDRAHLVAHSFGGVVALAFAAAYPQRVKSLVLADVRLWSVEPPTTEAPARWLERLRAAGLPLANPRIDLSVQLLIDLARMRLEQGDAGAVCEILPGARSLFPGPRAAAKWLRLVETTELYGEATQPDMTAERLAEVEQPVLAVYGGLSARRRSASALRQNCPDCQIRLIPQAGHFFPLTRPRLFALLAIAFMRAAARGTGAHRRRSVPMIVQQATPKARRLEAVL